MAAIPAARASPDIPTDTGPAIIKTQPGGIRAERVRGIILIASNVVTGREAKWPKPTAETGLPHRGDVKASEIQMKVHVQVSLQYGILFLYDPDGKPQIPSDTGAAPITFTDTCVCFWVADYVTGADVTLSNRPFDDSTPPTFSRRIITPTKYISVSDVPVNYYFLHRLKTDFADIDIWNYMENGREKSWVQISGLDLYELE
jgi:hypothetical protein